MKDRPHLDDEAEERRRELAAFVHAKKRYESERAGWNVGCRGRAVVPTTWSQLLLTAMCGHQYGSLALPRPKFTFLRRYIDHCPPYRRNRHR